MLILGRKLTQQKLKSVKCWGPGDSSRDLFGMVKWPFQGVKWPPTRGWKGHFESPGIVWDIQPNLTPDPCQLLQDVTWIDSPSGDHQQAPKRLLMGPKEVTTWRTWWFSTSTETDKLRATLDGLKSSMRYEQSKGAGRGIHLMKQVFTTAAHMTGQFPIWMDTRLY